MRVLLLKCCSCPALLRVMVTKYDGEKEYQLRGSTVCPCCNTHIAAGQQLEVLPTKDGE
jgi:hypothetical protein